MFKGLGDIASIMKQAKEMQGRMGDMQDRLAKMRIHGSSGGGMVDIEVNGKLDVLSCRIDPALLQGGDREMLEELVVSAMNDALGKSREAAADSMKDITGGINVPGLDAMMDKLGMKPDGTD